jgi:SAM-dependent MidA family methyltransferase
MADLLRAARALPGFNAAAQVTLIEASPALRQVQAETLAGHDPVWFDSAAVLPDQPLFAVANEFFDALPVRQFQRDGAGWRERRVGLDGDALAFGLSAPSHQPALEHRLDDTRDGDLVELCPQATPILTEIARRIATFGGAALIIDYGDWRSLGDTLQAVRDHQPANPLETPGQADLTAHVDFEPLAQAARATGCAHSKLTPQGVFLERLGITDRANGLAQRVSGDALEHLVDAHRRLTHPDEMGNLFKTLGLFPEKATPPPGLER